MQKRHHDSQQNIMVLWPRLQQDRPNVTQTEPSPAKRLIVSIMAAAPRCGTASPWITVVPESLEELPQIFGSSAKADLRTARGGRNAFRHRLTERAAVEEFHPFIIAAGVAMDIDAHRANGPLRSQRPESGIADGVPPSRHHAFIKSRLLQARLRPRPLSKKA